MNACQDGLATIRWPSRCRPALAVREPREQPWREAGQDDEDDEARDRLVDRIAEEALAEGRRSETSAPPCRSAATIRSVPDAGHAAEHDRQRSGPSTIAAMTPVTAPATATHAAGAASFRCQTHDRRRTADSTMATITIAVGVPRNDEVGVVVDRVVHDREREEHDRSATAIDDRAARVRQPLAGRRR